MSMFEWIVLGAVVVVVLGILLYRIVRGTARGRRFLKLSTRGKLRFARELMRDPAISPLAKVALVIAVGYLALPFDLIPDFIPVVGHLDDFVVLAAMVLILMAAVPRERFERALEAAQRPRIEAQPAGTPA